MNIDRTTGRERPPMRTFGTIRELPSGRFQARYRPKTWPKIDVAKTLDTHEEAEAFLDELRAEIDSGEYQKRQRYGHLSPEA